MIRPSGLTKATSMGVAAAFAALIAVALAPAGAPAAACSLSIGTCGCTIDSPGTYKLTGTSPMNSTGTCVDITASNVTLSGGLITIKGPGSVVGTYGVHIEPAANKVLLEKLTAEDFGSGVHVDGPNATLYLVSTSLNNRGVVVNGANAFFIQVSSELDFETGIQVNSTATDFAGMVVKAVGATGAGILLNGVSGAFLNQVIAEENGTFGIWLDSSSNNSIADFQAEDNGVAGVYLGCNAIGPIGTACPTGVSPSNSNSIIGTVGESTSSLVSNTASQRFGVVVGLGSLHNRFLSITGTGNVDDDALDENPECGSNRWFGDTFTTSVPAENTTFFCLN